MGNGGISQASIINQVNVMISNIIVNISLYCNAQSVSNQIIQIDCQPYGPGSNATQPWELNESCQKCMKNVYDSRLKYYKNQEELWSTRAPSVLGSINQDFQTVINEFVTCGINTCKACSMQNASQTSVVTGVLNCQAFNDVQNTISQQMITQITQNLTNNQDMLAPLAEMLGASSTNDIIYNLTNRVMTLLTKSVVANITETINNNQTISITVVGQAPINGLTQNSAYNACLTYLGKTNIMNGIFQQEQWDELQTLINEQNTIDSLGNAIVQSVNVISKLLNNVVGQVVIVVLCMVGVIFLAVVIYIIVHLIKKATQSKRARDDLLRKQIGMAPASEVF